MLLYNGQRGRGLKQLFYVFYYPAHVYLLYAPVLGRDALDGLSKEGFPMANLLVVDDDADLCALLRTALERERPLPLPPCRGARW